MILSAFFYLVYLVLLVATSPLRLLADVSLSATFSGGIESASTFISALNQVLPMTTILAIILFDLTFEGFYFAYKVIYWILKKIPTIS